MGKIAADLEHALARRIMRGEPGRTAAAQLAAGEGWSVADVVCTSGPADRRFQEQHTRVSVGVVVAGSFQYRSPRGRGVMTPGSLLLGNAGDSFECGHEHAAGDRCVAFQYAPAFFERIAADAGVPRGQRTFAASHLPPARELSPLTVCAAAGAAMQLDVSWEETAVQVAATAVRVAARVAPSWGAVTTLAAARVTDSIRRIEREPGAPWTLAQLAADARQSRYHYLRIFRQLTGVTPHQFVLRTRLRTSALRLRAEDSKVIDIALTAGFGDVSNFNAAFRREFGMAPRAYRTRRGRG